MLVAIPNQLRCSTYSQILHFDLVNEDDQNMFAFKLHSSTRLLHGYPVTGFVPPGGTVHIRLHKYSGPRSFAEQILVSVKRAAVIVQDVNSLFNDGSTDQTIIIPVYAQHSPDVLASGRSTTTSTGSM